jgi:hypothetical protein
VEVTAYSWATKTQAGSGATPITQTAQLLEVSRQRVLQMIGEGMLPGADR